MLHFQNTGNPPLSEVEFHLDAFFAAERPGDVNIHDFRTSLRASTVPPMGTEGVPPTASPRVLLIWPDVLTLESVVASVESQYRKLAVDGGVLAYTATVDFEEVLDTRVRSEELRRATFPR